MGTRHALPWRSAALLCVGLLLLAGAPVLRAGEEEDDEGKPAYGNTPEELQPFSGLGEPYHRYFTEPPTFRGPGRGEPEPEGIEEAAIGVLLPRSGPDVALGRSMQRGVQLSIEEANAEGGLRPGIPFRAHYRDEAVAWGATANAALELLDDYDVWGLVGALEDANTHVLTRILLKIELPTVNTGGPDPTLTEHMIPWLVRVRPDDRQTSYVLAKRIFHEDEHKRVAVLRSNDRYGRTGIKEFVDAARRLHKPIAVEVRFQNHTSDFHTQIQRLRGVRPDAIVLWGRAAASGRAMRALRAAGLKQPVYGPDRLADPAFLKAAGETAEGLVFTYPFNPERAGTPWRAFRARFEKRFGTPPDAVAAYAYDGTRFLLQSIRAAGLNRVRIREHMYGRPTYEGVTGTVKFDVTRNNVSGICLGHVENGAFRFE